MSGHNGPNTPARLPKLSPNTIKQGPMKATIPISSVLKTCANLKSNSPIQLSPTSSWKTRISPDQPSGQRSPGSSVYKVKSRTLGTLGSPISNIRRTSSLDTIYLKGQWPRESFYLHTSMLQVEKATQTDESDIVVDPRKINSIMETNDEKLEKMLIRHRLQRNKDPNGKFVSLQPSASSQTNLCYMSPITKASPINIPIKPLPKPAIRSSVEGLNQEIERLVLKSASSSGTHLCDRSEEYDKQFCGATLEGHRAPLAELLKSTRSIDTQTPADGDFTTGSCPSSGGSQNSSPDQEGGKLGTSPHINRFLAREPPDGCEKVHLKSFDEQKGLLVERRPRPCTFQLKPSLGSAFQLLQPTMYTPSDRDLPIVPPQQDRV